MRDNGGEPDEIVYNRIRSIANSVTIDDALKIWLSRTPIYGSLPGEANDASVVERFVDRYLKVCSCLHRCQQEKSWFARKACTKYSFAGL